MKRQKKFKKLVVTTFKKTNEIFNPEVVVVDGDTIKFNYKGIFFRFRIIGINTPEIHHETPQPFALLAKEKLTHLLNEHRFKIELHPKKIDKTGVRLLGKIFILKKNHYIDVAKILLEEGLAVPYLMEQGLSPTEQKKYWEIAERAKSRGYGVHSLNGYVTPQGRFNSN